MTARRIGTVVRIRDLQERLARAEVARRQAEARAAVERERRSWALLVEREATLHGYLEAGGLERRANTLGGALHAALRAGSDTVAAHTATDAALAEWTAAARDHDGVERLAERLDEEARTAEDRRAAADLDELVVQRHGARTARPVEPARHMDGTR